MKWVLCYPCHNYGVTVTDQSCTSFLWIMDVFRFVEPLETLHCDGEAERHEEDRVHQGA